MKKYTFIFLCAVCVLSFAAPARAAECANAVTYGTQLLSDGGAPYDVFSPGHEMILQGTCTDSGILVTVGSGKSSQYIFNTISYFDGSSWKNATLASLSPIGAWHVGRAYASIPSTARETRINAYVCDNAAGAWKCGCRDAACAQTMWQSQVVARGTQARPSTSSAGRSGSEPWLMAYYAMFQSGLMSERRIDYDTFTHLAVGPVMPASDGTLAGGFGDGGRYESTAKNIARRAHREGRKAILWVGGTDSEATWKQAAQPNTLPAFAKNLVTTMNDLGYDGLDLDWEPITQEDAPLVLALVKEVRKQAPDALITVPVMWVSSTRDRTQELAWYRELSQYADKIFIMSYSMTGTWDGWQSWFSSPLYGESAKTPASIDHAAQSYLKAGVSKSKLGIGTGLYGRCFVPPVTGPRMDIPQGYGWTVTSLPYSTVRQVLGDPEAVKTWDTQARVPYAYRTASSKGTYCSYLSYEDERSLREKVRYMQQKGLGGIIVWSLGLGYDEDDDDPQRLIRTLADEFGL